MNLRAVCDDIPRHTASSVGLNLSTSSAHTKDIKACFPQLKIVGEIQSITP